MENTKIEFHAACEIFPLMETDEFNKLCADIRENGLLEAIWLHDEKIIDGRNRYNACQIVGIEPEFRVWDGQSVSLISFVISLNLRRRHLTESQRGMVAARIADLKQGARTDLNLPSIEGRFSQSEAARLLNVSVSSVERAAKVLKDGVMELAAKVESGELKVATASKLAELPKTKQIKLVKRGNMSLVEYAKNLTVKKKLKKAKHTHDLCIVCNDDVQPTKENMLAFIYVAERRAGQFARYFVGMREEISELDGAEGVREYYEMILLAIDAGHQTFAQIRKYTRISSEMLRYAIDRMLDGRTIEEIRQGGKTEMARGAATKLYQRATLPDVIIKEEADEFDSNYYH